MSGGYAERKTDALSELFKAIQTAIETVERLRFDKEVFRHQLIVGSYLAMTETAESIRILIEADRVYDAEVLLRTLMELRVRLETFANCEGIANRERVEFVKNNCKKFEQAKQGNKYLTKIAEHIDVDKEIADAYRTLDELKLEGIKGQLKLSQMCEKLGFDDEYAAIYSGLSQTPHGTYSSIIKRNFVVDKTTDQFSVVGFRLPEIETVELVADAAIAWLNNAETILTEFLNASHIKQLQD